MTLADIVKKHEQAEATEEPLAYVWLRKKVSEQGEYEGWFDRWLDWVVQQPPDVQERQAKHILRTYISNTTYASAVPSGIAGYIDRKPQHPYGSPTSYTEKYPAVFAKCFTCIKKMDKNFHRELPIRWQGQREAANRIDQRFTIAGTVYSTLTVNHTWSTAAHRDAGDLAAGFSCIAAFTGPDGKGWKGGEFILPEYRVAIKLEPKDLLLVDSRTAIHANGPLLGNNNDRLTVVAYFREGMLKLKSWRYENLRRSFVEERGIWPTMWSSREWADYLAKHHSFDEDGIV